MACDEKAGKSDNSERTQHSKEPQNALQRRKGRITERVEGSLAMMLNLLILATLFYNALSSTTSSNSIIAQAIAGLRASQIKTILTTARIPTAGLYDKSELASLLLQTELQLAQQRAKLTKMSPLITIPLSSSNQEDVKSNQYVGVNLVIRDSLPLPFIVDTGASQNLLRASTAASLKLPTFSPQGGTSTIGLGGQGSLGKSTCILDNLKLNGHAIASSSYSQQQQQQQYLGALLVEDQRALPPLAQGLLGLTFLSALRGPMIEFDFSQKTLTWGPASCFLTPLQLHGLQKISIRKIAFDLIACDVYVNGKAAVAMIDLGSSFTIFNTLAIEKLFAPATLASLPNSPRFCAGFDGRPVAMKQLSTTSLDFAANMQQSRSFENFYASDWGKEVGLSSSPACILGLDVLGSKNKLLLDLEAQAMYI